jgi:hypothetical protein
MRLLISVGITCLLVACGPATESRDRMDALASRMSDSIVRSLDSALANPAKETGLIKQEAWPVVSNFTPAAKPVK